MTDGIFQKSLMQLVSIVHCIYWVEQVTISKNISYIFFWMIDFVFANIADPDEILHYVAFYLDFHYLLKYLLCGFWSLKGKAHNSYNITLTTLWGFHTTQTYYYQSNK